MKIVLFGANGGSGKRVVEAALAAGHDVTAVARRPESITTAHAKLRVVKGDVTDAASVEAAVAGADAVISTFGPANNGKPGTLMSVGVAHIVRACEKTNVSRFVFESGLMCSDGNGLSFTGKLGVSLYGWWYSALRRDKRIAEQSIVGSKIPHWVIVRPPALDDSPARGAYVEGVDARVDPARALSHADVAAFLLKAAGDDTMSKTIRAIGRD